MKYFNKMEPINYWISNLKKKEVKINGRVNKVFKR